MRRLNRRVKRQQARLERKAIQHLDDPSDIPGGGDNLAHLRLHLVYPRDALLHQPIGVVRLLRRLLRHLRAALYLVRHATQPLRQMGEAGVLRLMLSAYARVMLLHLACARRHAGGDGIDLINDMTQPVAHLRHGAEQLLRFARLQPSGGGRRKQVASGDALQLDAGVAQRRDNPARQQHAAHQQQREQQRADQQRQVTAVNHTRQRAAVDRAEFFVGRVDLRKPGVVKLLLIGLHRHHEKGVYLVMR